MSHRRRLCYRTQSIAHWQTLTDSIGRNATMAFAQPKRPKPRSIVVRSCRRRKRQFARVFNGKRHQKAGEKIKKEAKGGERSEKGEENRGARGGPQAAINFRQTKRRFVSRLEINFLAAITTHLRPYSSRSVAQTKSHRCAQAGLNEKLSKGRSLFLSVSPCLGLADSLVCAKMRNRRDLRRMPLFKPTCRKNGTINLRSSRFSVYHR